MHYSPIAYIPYTYVVSMYSVHTYICIHEDAGSYTFMYTFMLLRLFMYVIIELGLIGIPVFNTNNNCSSALSSPRVIWL